MKTTPKKRGEQVKAKHLYAYAVEQGEFVSDCGTDADIKSGFSRPVFILPASPESIEAMELQAHAAIADDPDYANIPHHQYLDLVGTVFRSLNLTPPRASQRRKKKV